ncbi:MAG: hypothetical protein AVDCRST_MAG68-2206 [uncultured Gemmatimonadetes bacterium]|uniref:Uncharacterized protein n=1 Tax=uncultured Gemmatimonadota bacterium TaxID=203437 RepID=A0A6J4L6R5_9BACT|nr:MAG: hypothetical protein AVDCRST_MAG68-2206 [uncultured Gemmatimonadota bacterium]
MRGKRYPKPGGVSSARERAGGGPTEALTPPTPALPITGEGGASSVSLEASIVV